MRSIEIPQPEDRDWRYRSLEILPGALTWIILTLPVILTWISPILAAYFIVAYFLLWFIRGIGLDVRSLQGYRLMNHHKRLPWTKLNQDLEALVAKTPGSPKWHIRNIARVERNMGHDRILPSQIYHAVFVAFWNESLEVLQPTIESVINSNYDPKKMILILAYEQRGGPEIEARAKKLIKDYGHHFYHAEAVMHPWPMLGEVIGKGGNISFAGRKFKKYLQQAKIDPNRVIVTTLDADNRPDHQYFAALTYTYCSTEEPKYASYQPISMYTNNIWDAPAPMRVVAVGNSVWSMVVSTRTHMLRNFAAHSQSMAALIDTDFWSARTIVEDGHQYWRTFFRYDGKHDVFPIFLPIYQDAVLTSSYRRTLFAQFKQVQRWAWGASDIAYVFYNGFLKPNKIPKLKVLARFLRLLENHVSWSTASLLIFLGARVVLFLSSGTYIGNQLPQVVKVIAEISLVGILTSFFVSMKSLPPKPARYKRSRTFWMVAQWGFILVTPVIYGSFAAINAQTRLMFGKYLGWVITEKAVKS